MTVEDFITEAIDLGHRDGIASLNANQRMVFLISEAEIICDMNGIDSFLGHFNSELLLECASAFDEVGAREILQRNFM
jgi:hypothetical protein